MAGGGKSIKTERRQRTCHCSNIDSLFAIYPNPCPQVENSYNLSTGEKHPHITQID